MADRPSPFDGLQEWIDQLNRQLEEATRTWESEFENRSQLDLSTGGSTSLDLADEDDAFVVTVDVPGFDKEDLELELRGETLSISGERTRTIESGDARDDEVDETGEMADADDAGEGTYIRHERKAQSFSRQLRLPAPVDADDVTATVNNGVLTVRLPKLEPDDGSRSIDIE